jgi:preprotein translocase subunit SecG
MLTFVTVLHVFTCTVLILVVLIQSGKGAEISASLGGSSQTVFGSSGGANFFTRFTASAAAIFMVTSVALTVMHGKTKKSLFEDMPVNKSAPAAPAVPAVPATTGAAPAVPAKTAAAPVAQSAPAAPAAPTQNTKK